MEKKTVIIFLLIGVALGIITILQKPGPSPTGYLTFTPGTPLVDPNGIGFGSQSRSNNYEVLLNSLFANGNVATNISTLLWVPWYSTSTSCTVADLHSGASCNSGETIDMTHNCMVTDEFSQVGILVAMAQNQTRMDQFFNTVNAINSNYGKIPAWRIYRSGTTVEQCRSGINGNCDTASDATARIIIALYTASNNTAFSAGQRALYRELATNLSADFVKYEVLYSCTQSSLGHGQICYWMAAGSGAKSGGFGASDFAYTGYYGDGIIAMLQACSQTNNMTYCAVAGNFTLNYLEAAKFDGATFRTPPGRSFKWTNTSGIPAASCTNTCSPDQWDYADASRAVGVCAANYYAALINTTLPGLESYCTIWGNRYMNSTSSIPIQYYSNGTNSASYQSGYFAQGLEALFQMGGHNQNLFQGTLDSALSHYGTGSKTWDNTACFGVYTQAFAVRALGAGIGRDIASFPMLLFNTTVNTSVNSSNDTNQSNQSNTSLANISITVSPPSPVSINDSTNQTFVITLTNPSNQSTITTWHVNGTNQTQRFNASNYTYFANTSVIGVWNISATIISGTNNLSNTWTLTVVNSTNASTNASNNVSVNTSSNSTNETNTTVTPTVQSPAPVASAGGGGGGGGIVLAPNNSTATKSDIKQSIRNDFTTNTDARIIVHHLRTYYGGAK